MIDTERRSRIWRSSLLPNKWYSSVLSPAMLHP